jgi:hypothetical protein
MFLPYAFVAWIGINLALFFYMTLYNIRDRLTDEWGRIWKEAVTVYSKKSSSDLTIT